MIITNPPRFTHERHVRIVEWLNAHGRVEVLELARLLDVSEHTIRRDLEALQGAVRPLTVITNSLDIAAVFDRDPLVQLVVLGGVWQPDARAFWGHATCQMLAHHRADWAVPGACAVALDAGATASEEPDAMLKQAMIRAARRTLVLADHSKVGGVAPYHVANWEQVHTLVTDRAWPELEARGVVVKVVDGAAA